MNALAAAGKDVEGIILSDMSQPKTKTNTVSEHLNMECEKNTTDE